MAYGKKLTAEEIRKRLIRLTNLERLYAAQVADNVKLKAENRQLKELLAVTTSRFEALIQKQQIRIAELEKMVFSSRPAKVPPGGPSPDGHSGAGMAGGSPAKQQRQPASFRRPIPRPEDVTSETSHLVAGCTSCGGPLSRIRDHVHYVEDVVLPVVDGSTTKTVTKQYVQSGWCASCQATVFGDGIELRGSQVVLGNNVRLLTAYFLTAQDMTYSQMVTVFRDLYGLAVSGGELAAMAARQGVALLPENEAIAKGIREGPGCHLDETSYNVFSQGMGWAWCLGSTANEDVIYHLTESRGRNHVKALLGTNCTGVHVHDCYAAYKQLDASGLGQTCWSHYYRVVRDLAALDAEALGSEAAQEHCKQAKAELGAIYADLRQYLTKPFDQTQRDQQRTKLQARIDWFCVPHPNDPEKLSKLKNRMQEWRHTLLTCLTMPDIPADNNKAERHLRKLVLKRKKSFGVRNLKTAKTLSTLMSVVRTHANRNRQQPGRLLPALAELVRG
jgi:transposase